MEDKIDYLNFIDRIDIPTTDDFFDYFRIFTLLLQEEAKKRTRDDINPENFKAYRKTYDGTIEIGSKLEYDYKSFIFEFGVRFQVKSSVGYYSLFFNQLPLWQKATKCILSNSRGEVFESDIDFDCSKCNEITICDSIYHVTGQIIDSISHHYTDCKRMLNEDEELIGIEVRLGGDYRDIYHQTCEFIDFILPLLIRFRFIVPPASSAVIASPYYTELHDALTPNINSFSPSFKIQKICSDTIEEIYNETHGIDNEYREGEPPF